MESNIKNKAKYIRLASIVAIFGNSILALLKIIVGFSAKSNALVADGVDSSSDVLVSILTLIIVGIISKPADKEHPWGHRRAETIATVFFAFVIFFMGAQLVINSVTSLFRGDVSTEPSKIALIVTCISIISKLLLAVSQYIIGKRTDSVMLKANAKNMACDVLISVGVLTGLIISFFTNSAYPDIIFTILIGLWIIKTAIGIFIETNQELMDGSKSTKPYRIIIESVDAVEGASNPHRARMRRIAGFWDISFDINIAPNCSLKEAHDIATKVEDEIKMRLENIFDIMVHIEPRGDTAIEAFGLSEDDMRASDNSEIDN